jgi:predicted dehydrogenase
MPRSRLAVVGVGHLGKEHARILAAHPGIQLAGVADQRAEQAESVALRCATRAFTDHWPLLDQVDAAVIAVPTVHHHAVACDFLRHGIPLLIEKPIASSVAEADELLHLARQHGTFLQTGHIERFNPVFEELAKHPMRPKMVSAQRLAPFSGRSLDIGVVLDLMIHDIDLLLTIVPAPLRDVDAVGISVLGGHEDLGQARLTFANGCTAHLTASRLHSAAVRRMDIWSAEGYAGADFHRRELVLIQPSERLRQLQASRQPLDATVLAGLRSDPFSGLLERREIEVVCSGPDQLTRELNDFISAVQTGSAVRVTGQHGRDALAAASMVLDSIHRHTWEGEVAGPMGPHTLPVPLGPLFAPAAGQSAAA